MIMPEEPDPICREERKARFRGVLRKALARGQRAGQTETEWIRDAEELRKVLSSESGLRGRRILFAVFLDDTGCNLVLSAMLRQIRGSAECMRESTGGMIVDGGGELYTRAAATELALAVSMAGCLLVDRSLTEATGSLENYRFKARQMMTGLRGAYERTAEELTERILLFDPEKLAGKKLLCLHAAGNEASNTKACWEMVREKLEPCWEITEIGLKNGEVRDCIGCDYYVCKEYGSRSACCYRDAVVEKIYPALEECSRVLLLCPNYNDALGANLTAVINRLTALFRKRPFSDRFLYAVIISGCSGGDLLARQLIAALNMNKAFVLPPRFALMETANAPAGIRSVPQIRQKTAAFAEEINKGCLRS